jgi:hypothetical protein
MISCSDRAKLPDQQLNGENSAMPHEPTDQNSPAEVLKKVHFAILNKDRGRYMECYRVPPDGQTIIEAFYTGWVAQYDFVAAIENAYGPKGLAYFQDIRTMKKAGMHNLVLPPLHSPWWESEQVEIRISGNEARYNDPYFSREWRMVRTGDVWRIDLRLSELTDSPEWERRCVVMFTEVLRACKPEIGKPGVTIDDIRLKLGKLDTEALKNLGPRHRAARK